MNKLCINVLTGFEFDEMCKYAKEAGFDGVFSDSNDAFNLDIIRKNRRSVDKYGLFYETSHSVIPGCRELWHGKIAAERYGTILNTCIDNCAAIAVPILIVHIETDKQPLNIEDGMMVLENIVRYAQNKGVSLAFENINCPHLLYHVMDTFKDSHVGFCYDLGHELCHTPEEDFLSRLGERLICTHIHDNDGKSDSHHLPYTGAVDFNRISAQLRELHYTGPLSLEVVPDREDRSEFMARAFMSVSKFREAIQL